MLSLFEILQLFSLPTKYNYQNVSRIGICCMYLVIRQLIVNEFVILLEYVAYDTEGEFLITSLLFLIHVIFYTCVSRLF